MRRGLTNDETAATPRGDPPELKSAADAGTATTAGTGYDRGMSFFAELSRRRVFRVAAMYGITAWIIIEVSATVLPALYLPEMLVTGIVVVLIAGFPVALVLAWIFDIEPGGVQRTENLVEAPAVTAVPRRLGYLVLLSIATAMLGGFFYWRVDTADVPRDSIAVLPFINLSADPSTDYFSDGISEELLNLLAKVPGLNVAARTSSFAYKGRDVDVREVARKLGVVTVLEGSVRWSQDQGRVRITAQLIDAETGYHLFSESYDRDLKDIFALQDEIALAIVDKLRVELAQNDTPAAVVGAVPPTASVEAYTLYLRGRALWKKRGEDEVRESIELFQAALARDPGFARAYSNLAAAYVVLPMYLHEPPEGFLGQAREAALMALTLDSSLAEAHAVQALIAQIHRDWSEAETGFFFATGLDPSDSTTHHWYSRHLAAVGRLDAALEEARTAAALDETSAVIHANLAMRLEGAGLHAEAEAAAARAVELGLDDSSAGLLAELYLWRGNFDQALAVAGQKLQTESQEWDEFRSLVEYLQTPSGEALFDDDVTAFFAYATSGRHDEAFDLAESLTASAMFPLERCWTPAMQAFREDPRFGELMHANGLVDYWRRYGWPAACRPGDGTIVCT